MLAFLEAMKRKRTAKPILPKSTFHGFAIVVLKPFIFTHQLRNASTANSIHEQGLSN
jgi:hypothetical protein